MFCVFHFSLLISSVHISLHHFRQKKSQLIVKQAEALITTLLQSFNCTKYFLQVIYSKDMQQLLLLNYLNNVLYNLYRLNVNYVLDENFVSLLL